MNVFRFNIYFGDYISELARGDLKNAHTVYCKMNITLILYFTICVSPSVFFFLIFGYPGPRVTYAVH